MYSESEKVMWAIPPKDRLGSLSTSEINEKYERGERHGLF